MQFSPTILVAEDDPDVRQLVVQYLEAQGYRVLEAANGDSALRILNTHGPIDLLLTDIVMPGSLDGFDLGRRAAALVPGLKVLHVTGYAEHAAQAPDLVRRGGLLSKPFNQAQLIATIGRLVGSWTVHRNPVLRHAYDYWLRKADGRPYPDRADLDPAEIKPILPHLSIIETLGDIDQARFRFRLIGTEIVHALGRDVTGQLADDFYAGDYADFIFGLWRRVVATGQPIYAASSFHLNEVGLSTERLLLPFSAKAGPVRHIVGVQTFDWRQRRMTVHQLMQAQERTDTVEALPETRVAH